MDRMGSHQPLVRPIQGHPTNAAHPNLAEIAGDLRGLGGGGVAFVSSVQSESLPRLLRSAGASVTDPEAKILRRFVPKLFAQGRQEFRPAELKLLTPDARIHLHLEHLAPHALGTGVLRHLCPHGIQPSLTHSGRPGDLSQAEILQDPAHEIAHGPGLRLPLAGAGKAHSRGSCTRKSIPVGIFG